MDGQEVQFLGQDGQFLGALVGLLQGPEHQGPDDEVQHHQKEDGRHRLPSHDGGPCVVLVLVGIQPRWLCGEGQAGLGEVGCRLWVQKIRRGHCEGRQVDCDWGRYKPLDGSSLLQPLSATGCHKEHQY